MKILNDLTGLFDFRISIQYIKNMIKNLIFDVGGVLLDYRWKEMLMDYGLDEADAVRVGTQMFDDPDRTWSIFDLGTKTDEEIADTFCKKYDGITEENVMDILKKEVGEVFVHVLEDAGVYKCTEEGREAFLRFVKTL